MLSVPNEVKARRRKAEQFEADQTIIPIVIRPNIKVHISGIPHDLTFAEAEKIARVVMAYGSETNVD